MNYIETIHNKIYKLEELESINKKWKENYEIIVFTNGCFDILHYGHFNYLAKAKELGSKLIIGLNTDDSVKRLKGNDRPINNQDVRAFNLASLLVVDAVCLFDEDTPEKLINKLIPNVLVKGGDYKLDNIVGADCVLNNRGKVITIPFVENFSSTILIKKLIN